jgi:hypothetical protein
MMENNNLLNRRRFLKNSLLAAGGIFIAPLIISCSDDNFTEGGAAPDDLKNQVLIPELQVLILQQQESFSGQDILEEQKQKSLGK